MRAGGLSEKLPRVDRVDGGEVSWRGAVDVALHDVAKRGARSCQAELPLIEHKLSLPVDRTCAISPACGSNGSSPDTNTMLPARDRRTRGTSDSKWDRDVVSTRAAAASTDKLEALGERPLWFRKTRRISRGSGKYRIQASQVPDQSITSYW